MRPRMLCVTAAPRKPPAFTVAVAMPLKRGGFTSRARAHVSVKQLAARPRRKQSGPSRARGGPAEGTQAAGPDAREDGGKQDLGPPPRPEDLVGEKAGRRCAEDDA